MFVIMKLGALRNFHLTVKSIQLFIFQVIFMQTCLLLS